MRYQAGDSAGAVDAVARAVVLAPRSVDVMLNGANAMLALRRYDDARDLLARARALEPEAPGVQVMGANLALAVGDTVALSAAVRALRAGGSGPSAVVLPWLRYGDAGLQRELAAASLATLGAATANDSGLYYGQKAQLFLTHGEPAKARALVDSGYRLVTSHEATFPAGSTSRRAGGARSLGTRRRAGIAPPRWPRSSGALPTR